jgi:glucan biosynthesis protein C
MSTATTPSRVPEDDALRKPLRRDLSIDYLRTTLTLMVLAHHSCLAYTSWAHFDTEHMFRSTAPVVDSTRWAFFDYAENFNDVFFMTLMFFVSGLFVYPALRRHGTLRFLRDRLLRLGAPFAFAVVVLMPIAYYASWQLTGRNVGFLDFYKRLAAGGFAAGPPWFIWVLLLFDVILALLLVPFGRSIQREGRMRQRLRDHPIATFLSLFLASAIVYLPLLARFGFGTWTVLFTSPFSFQICRIGLYGLWFLFGVFVGAPGFGDGLLARDGGLARRWPWWVAGCIVAYNALWFVPRLEVVHRLSPSGQGALEALLWVLSCVASCLGFLALFRGVELQPRSWMLSLSRSAYGMYLVHYVYVTWTQRLLMDRPIPAGIKFLFVFLATTLLSWMTAQIALRIPGLKRIL